MTYGEAKAMISDSLTGDARQAWIGYDEKTQTEFADIIICEGGSVQDAALAFTNFAA